MPKHKDLVLFGLSKGTPPSLLPLQMGTSIPRMLNHICSSPADAQYLLPVLASMGRCLHCKPCLPSGVVVKRSCHPSFSSVGNS